MRPCKVLRAIRKAIPHYDGRKGFIEAVIPKTSKDIEDWMKVHLPNRHNPEGEDNVVGFDVEWKPHNKPGQRHRISLVQLARPSSVLLVQLHRHQDGVPKALSSLISSKHIVKAGVGVLEDLKRFEEDHGLPVTDTAFVDLGAVAKRHEVRECLLSRNKTIETMTMATAMPTATGDEVGEGGANTSSSSNSSSGDDGEMTAMNSSSSNNIDDLLSDGNYVEQTMKSKSAGFGLAMLAEKYVGCRPTKPKSIQLSNWERHELSEDQITYAAYDAHMGIDVYHHLMEVGALHVESQEHIRQFSHLYWAASASKPVHRTHVRNLWLRACESSDLLDKAAQHLMDEDARWLAYLSSISSSSSSSAVAEKGGESRAGAMAPAAAVGEERGTTADTNASTSAETDKEALTWSKAMLAVLSRFGVTPKYVLVPASKAAAAAAAASARNKNSSKKEEGNDKISANSSSSSSSSSSSGKNLKSKGNTSLWEVLIVHQDRVLGRGWGRGKASAREAACEHVLTDLMAMQQREAARVGQPGAGRTELFTSYAGKGPLPACFVEYVRHKPLLAGG